MNSSMTSFRLSCRTSRRNPLPLLLVLLMCAGCVANPAPLGAVEDGVDVLHYDVDLSVNIERLRISGRTTITLVREAHVDELTLGLNGPVVDSVFSDGVRVEPFALTSMGFSLPLNSARDTVSIEIYYHGVPREGLYEGTYAGARFVYTDGWPNRVAGWMPGVHHPADPARLVLTLRTDPELTAVGSGRLVESTRGNARWTLDASAPTYTFAFAVGPYDRVVADTSDFEIAHYAVPGDVLSGAQAMRRAGSAIRYFESILGPYPYETLATVQVPFDFAGMENATALFLSTMLYGTNALEEVMVHEIAHQWFGNDLTIADWTDLWISEGISTYLTTLFYEEMDGEEAAHQLRSEFSTLDVGAVSALVPERIESPYDMLTWLVYRKGAAVMHLLRLKLGDEAFFDALRNSYRSHRPGPASTESFLRSFRDAAVEPLEDIIDFWVYGDRIPRLITRWDSESEMLAWRIQDDAGTLADLGFFLEIRTEEGVSYVDVRDTAVALPGSAPETVRPVGITMITEAET